MGKNKVPSDVLQNNLKKKLFGQIGKPASEPEKIDYERLAALVADKTTENYENTKKHQEDSNRKKYYEQYNQPQANTFFGRVKQNYTAYRGAKSRNMISAATKGIVPPDKLSPFSLKIAKVAAVFELLGDDLAQELYQFAGNLELGKALIYGNPNEISASLDGASRVYFADRG